MSGKKVAIAQGGMRGEAKKTKVVFKNVLDTPFNIQWPEVSADNNAIVLDTVCDMVKPIRDYHNSRPKQDAKPDKKHKKSSTKEPTGSISSKPSTALATLTNSSSASVVPSEPSTAAESTSTPAPPAILKSTILGINAITKALERSIQDLSAHPAPTAIILCKGDLIPSHLYAHLGPMIAMLPGVLLFPLLKGSERRLSEALGLPAVGALAIQSTEGSREAEDLVMILKGMVEPMTAPWLPKVALNPVAKEKNTKQPSATKPTEIAISGAGAGAGASSLSTEPVSGKTAETPKVVASQAGYIVTNIKTIKTTMPIVVKTPKPAKSDNTNTINNNNNKSKGGQQQQSQQQKQKQKQQQSQSQNLKQKQQQVNQGKNKKPPVDNLDSDHGQGKKAKNN
ncbi:hypothetical protein BGZ96_001281 [Linnemannia gamsii]|uniref:Uncharacterized protein n=1 Tax=Linnemannia gamsii TaxID=64522 RepID=A0ABQ7JMU9_9FUNG|nr:hypothetical protein BGZ96_001281 [Linnemannia gamsii]